MSIPDFIVSRADLTPNGALSTYHWSLLKGKLLKRGIILIPSDTCYSLAAIAADRDTFDRISKILNRGNEPLSLAFPNVSAVEHWVKMSLTLASILERFTPGPITIVCEAKENEFITPFTTKGLRSSDRTIGVRIPDSYIERDLSAAMLPNYLITTVAVRDPNNGQPIRDFELAQKIVTDGILRLDHQVGWAAVEGLDFREKHSTVVRVSGNPAKVDLIREGAITFNAIKESIQTLPAMVFEDWG